MRIDMGASSHVGKVREVNEDAYLTLDSLAVVADGMGGHTCGDVASRLAVTAFERLAGVHPLHPEHIHQALHQANLNILERISTDQRHEGMGTTVTGVALVDYAGAPHWLVFNIGDSRVYRLRPDLPQQLTVDHSEVAELVAAGAISDHEARVHPLRNVITRSLGTTPAPAADVWVFPTNPGDAFLLCSDGLTNELDDATIGRLVTQARSPRDAAPALVAAAVDEGGRDNVTAIVLELADPAPQVDDTEIRTAPRASRQEGAA